MKPHYAQFVKDFEKLTSDLNETMPKITPFVDGCCDQLRTLIFWDKGWVEDRRAEAHAKTAELQGSVQKFTTQCHEDCATVRACDSMMQAAEAFKDIDFDDLLNQLELDTIIGDRGGWQSDNEPLYEAKIEQLKPKVEGLKQAVRTLVDSMERIDAAEDSYVTGGLVSFGGFVVALAGLFAALATGWSGVGAIIGLIIAVLGVIFALAAFFTLTDIEGEVNDQTSVVNQAATTVDNSGWPAKPSFDQGW